MVLLDVLIIIMVIILLYNLFFVSSSNNVIEGYKNKKKQIKEGYDDYEKSTGQLAQKNAANISDLHDKIKALTSLNNKVDGLAARVKNNTKLIQNINKQKARQADAVMGK